MENFQVGIWLPPERQRQLVNQLIKRVGLTRVRAECFVRLWVYLYVKAQVQVHQQSLTPPLGQLEPPGMPISCTLREAAALFYSDKEVGSERSAGMILDKLAALGLIQKQFDGNTTQISITLAPAALAEVAHPTSVTLRIDDFDPRCDAIPVANLLATVYNWMNRNTDALPYRITRLLRTWASQYQRGMRVLRRSDNLNPVGFYLLYPTAPASEPLFFGAANKGLHISSMSETDPFVAATPGDPACVSVFIRSWVIDPQYKDQYQSAFLEDAQQILRQMQQDFPHLCDLYTMIIHPSYEEMATTLGFQRANLGSQAAVDWLYLALDRFLALEIASAFAQARNADLKRSATEGT